MHSVPRTSLAVVAAFLCLMRAAPAVIVSGSDGTQNTTAPSDNPYWDNVDSMSGGTALYLGNDWVITAAHLSLGNPTFDGTSYSMVAGSSIQLTNTDSSFTDLIMFRISSDPLLPALTLAPSTPGSSTPLEMIGNGGAARDVNTTRWIVSGSTWTTTSFGGNASGYGYQAGNTKRWGVINVSAGLAPRFDGAYNNVMSFETTFTTTLNSAQAVPGDSGGAVFANTGSGMELAGVILGMATFSGQPSGTVVNSLDGGGGDATIVGDIGSYRAEINTILATPVPEPSSLPILAAIGALTVVGRRLRRP